MSCPLCLAFSGRFDMNLRCCQVRELAGMPKAQRLAAYAQVRAEEGAAAFEALRVEVNAEYRRAKAAKR